MRVAVAVARRVLLGVLSLSCLLALVPAVAAADPPYEYYRTIDTSTASYPDGVAVDPSGNVYVADLYGWQVLKFDPSGNRISSIGGIEYPTDVATDASGDVYVSDYLSGNGAQEYDPSGKPTTTFGPGQAPYGSYGVSVDSAGNVYTMDPSTGALLGFDQSGHNFRSLPWGGCLSNNPFLHPAVDASGDVYIAGCTQTANGGPESVDEFDRSGSYVKTIGYGQLCQASSTALDGAGNLYVLDPCNADVAKFDPSGNLLRTIGSGQLVCPSSGLSVSASGDVYVLDPCSSAVMEFGPYGPPASVSLSSNGSPIVAGRAVSVTATVTDANGHPGANLPVDFAVTGTGLSGVQTTDQHGQATFSYSASRQAGSETVTAFVDVNGSGTDDTGDPSASKVISVEGYKSDYASCAQVAAQVPGAQDGTYNIRVAGTVMEENCRGLSGSDPRGYMSLVNTGSANYSAWTDSRFRTRTEFTKVRVVDRGAVVGGMACTADVCIDTTDYTYSTSTGGSQFGPNVQYATAPGCGLYNGGPSGTGNVDLTGTPLAVAPNAFHASGFIPYGSADYSDNNQVVNLTGNGWCGGESPVDSPLLPLRSLGGAQSISFPSESGATYGQTGADPGATASSGLPVTYSAASGACTLDSSGRLDFTTAGQCTVTASQPGDGGNYIAAYPVTDTFTVAKAPLMVNAQPATMTYGGVLPPLGSTLSGFVNGDTATNTVITGTASCAAVHPTPPLDVVAGGYPGAVTCSPGTLQASNYSFTAGFSATLTIIQASQSISFPPTSAILGQADFSPATASSGLPVSYASQTPSVCTSSPSGGAIHLVANGTCTVTASQGGNVDYKAASDVQRSFVVGTPPTITSAAATSLTAGTPGTFTVASTGYPKPSISETGALPAGVTLTDNGDGSATLAGVPATGSGGVYPITITAANGFKPDATQSFSLTVYAPTTTTLAASPAPANVAQPVTYTATVSASPTANAGSVTFSDNGATITGCAAVPVSGGQALCQVQYAATGNHSIQATFNPGGIWLGSTATAIGETVANCGTSLRGCNLKGGDLTGANLAGQNLSGANLSGIDLQGANLAGANLAGANLKDASLAGANLAGADLAGDNLMGAGLRNANLSNANLQGSNLKGDDLTGANLHGAATKGANLSGVIWSNTVCPDGTGSNLDAGTCTNNL